MPNESPGPKQRKGQLSGMENESVVVDMHQERKKKKKKKKRGPGDRLDRPPRQKGEIRIKLRRTTAIPANDWRMTAWGEERGGGPA